jgi:hypothetical protein
VHSLLTGSGAAATSNASVGWLPYVVALLAAGVLAIGYLWEPGRPSPLEWYVLATAVATVAAVLGYSAFFYHYPAFAAPWLALSIGCAAGSLASGFAGRPQVRRAIIGCCAVVVVAVAAFQVNELSGLRATSVYPARALIPAGSCVVSDEISLAIAANRFTAARPGCPDVLDGLAQTLVLSNGVSVQGGAAAHPDVVPRGLRVAVPEQRPPHPVDARADLLVRGQLPAAAGPRPRAGPGSGLPARPELTTGRSHLNERDR